MYRYFIVVIIVIFIISNLIPSIIMYRSQDVVKNQAKQKAASAEDDFDF